MNLLNFSLKKRLKYGLFEGKIAHFSSKKYTLFIIVAFLGYFPWGMCEFCRIYTNGLPTDDLRNFLGLN